MKTTRKLIIILMMAILFASCSPETKAPEHKSPIWLEQKDGNLLEILFDIENATTFTDEFKPYIDSDPRTMTAEEKKQFETLVRKDLAERTTVEIVNETGKPFSIEMTFPKDMKLKITYDEDKWEIYDTSETDPELLKSLSKDARGNVWLKKKDSIEIYIIKNINVGEPIYKKDKNDIKKMKYYYPDMKTITSDVVQMIEYENIDNDWIISDGDFLRRSGDYVLSLPLTNNKDEKLISFFRITDGDTGINALLSEVIPENVVAKLNAEESIHDCNYSTGGFDLKLFDDGTLILFSNLKDGEKLTDEDFPTTEWNKESENEFSNIANTITLSLEPDNIIMIRTEASLWNNELKDYKDIFTSLEGLVGTCKAEYPKTPEV